MAHTNGYRKSPEISPGISFALRRVDCGRLPRADGAVTPKLGDGLSLQNAGPKGPGLRLSYHGRRALRFVGLLISHLVGVGVGSSSSNGSIRVSPKMLPQFGPG